MGKSKHLFLEEDATIGYVHVRNEWTDLSGESHSTAKKSCYLGTVYASYSTNKHSNREREDDAEATKNTGRDTDVKRATNPCACPSLSALLLTI